MYYTSAVELSKDLWEGRVDGSESFYELKLIEVKAEKRSKSEKAIYNYMKKKKKKSVNVYIPLYLQRHIKI